jgi:uncharacterized protein (DUF1697 family)
MIAISGAKVGFRRAENLTFPPEIAIMMGVEDDVAPADGGTFCWHAESLGGRMTVYAALLRGINVGRNQRIAMADLRALLTDLGHNDVRTLLQSGNAVFDSTETDPDKVAAGIERAIKSKLGKTVRCLVRDGADLKRVVSDNPLDRHTDDPTHLHVTFLSARPDPKLVKEIDPAGYAPEEVAFGQREIYNWYPEGFRTAKLTYAFFEKHLGVVATARNWNTVTKLLAMLD